MSLKDNQNLYIPTPILSSFSSSSCQKGLGFSQNFNHSSYSCTVQWPWPLLKGLEKTKAKMNILRIPAIVSSSQRLISQFACQKTCFCASSCYSQALYTSLSGAALGSNLGDKREKKGNIFHTFFPSSFVLLNNSHTIVCTFQSPQVVIYCISFQNFKF